MFAQGGESKGLTAPCCTGTGWDRPSLQGWHRAGLLMGSSAQALMNTPREAPNGRWGEGRRSRTYICEWNEVLKSSVRVKSEAKALVHRAESDPGLITTEGRICNDFHWLKNWLLQHLRCNRDWKKKIIQACICMFLLFSWVFLHIFIEIYNLIGEKWFECTVL